MDQRDSAPAATEVRPALVDRAPAGRVGYFRWVICGLLFFATTINYVDRSVLGVLAKNLEKEIGWNAASYGHINAAFTLAYAIGFLIVGRFIDRVGLRISYTVSLIIWSLAAAGHALARTPFGFGVARFMLGLGEAGNFPAAIKTTAEWFPKRERALATGIFNAGSNVGAILAPLLVPLLYAEWGWQAAFIATGLAGIVWIFLWLPLYRRPDQHPWVSAGELAHIQSDPPDPITPIPWLQLLPHRQTWAFAIGKFLTDSIWWFYLFWIPPFLYDRFQVDLKSLGPPMVIIYLLADVGSVAGGWLSSSLLKRNWTVNAARKLALLVCAICVVPVSMAPLVEGKWVAVLLIGLAAAAHQGFSANFFTLASDMFPRRAVGSIVGIGGMAGALGGLLLQETVGQSRQRMGNYLVPFTIAASAYLLSLLIFHVLVPRIAPVRLHEREPEPTGA